MVSQTVELQRLTMAEHPENRPDPVRAEAPRLPEKSDSKPGFFRALAGMWIAGTVGCLLTLMTVAYPLGAGDTVAAFSMLPLALVLIAIVNGWIAANLFLGSGLRR